jgi:ketoreductase RED2
VTGADQRGRFGGKVVVVTGSTVGIGLGVARSFADEGAAVVLNSVSTIADGERLAAEFGPCASYINADVADEAQCKHLVDRTLERHGRIDVLVNNAGVGPMVPHSDLDGVTDDMWDRTFAVNLRGPWYLTRAAIPALRQDGGCVINITSLAGVRDTFYSAIPYALSKAALNHLTQLLANVLGPEIRVNAVAPGLIESRQSKSADVWDTIVERTRHNTPLGRVGVPADIGDTCVLLALSTYVTGQVVLCDGGKHLRAGSPPAQVG